MDKLILKPSPPKGFISNSYRPAGRIKAPGVQLNNTTLQQNDNENNEKQVNERKSLSKSDVSLKKIQSEPVKMNQPMLKQVQHKYYVDKLKKYWKKFDGQDYFCKIYREHFYQIFNEIKTCKGFRQADESTVARKSVSFPKRVSHKSNISF